MKAVTLRAVAREVGVAAPSIYLHFESVESLMRALLIERFDELDAEVTTAIESETDTGERLRAGCRAYCQFAMTRPSVYDVMFGGAIHALVSADGIGLDSLNTLVNGVAAAVDDGAIPGVEPFVLARRLWVGMHGMVTLRSRMPDFPWDPLADALDQLLADVGGLDKQTDRRKVPNKR